MTIDPRATLVLVDFNNVDPRASNEATIRDTLELVLTIVRDAVKPQPGLRPREAHQVDLRLYDGWLDKTGNRMEKCRRTERLVSDILDGLREGVRITTKMVTAMACMPNSQLRGTYINKGQKMVDQILAQDLHFFAGTELYNHYYLIANDEDYVPVALSAALRYRTPITWIRSRPDGRNDDHLTSAKVNLSFNHNWTR